MFTRVLVDANVLASRTLRDWILMLQIEASGVFATCWTEDILAETIHAIRRRHPDLDGGAMTTIANKLREVMSERIEDFRVEPLEGLTDKFDLHVHGAAMGGAVNMLVTQDAGFLALPDAVLAALPYEVLTADAFLTLIDDSGPEYVRTVTERQFEHWRKRDPATDLPARLRTAGCPAFAERVYHHQRA